MSNYQTESESAYNASKPFMLIVTAIVTWLISFVLFIVGLSFAKPVIIWGHDITVLVSAGISFVITMIELSFNDAVIDNEKDFVILLIGGAAYLLGIGVGYIALIGLLDLSDPRIEKIASITLSIIFEVAPERLMIMGLRRLDIRWGDVTRRLMDSFRRRPKQQQSQPKKQSQGRQIQQQQTQARQQSQTSLRTPRVPRPGTYHAVGQPAPAELSDEELLSMIAQEEE